MKIALGSDHAGFEYKTAIGKFLTTAGHEIHDFGTYSTEPVDYPDFIRPAAESVARGEYERAVVLGGSGNGEAMTANRIRGVRCALCHNDATTLNARLHNNANMLALGSTVVNRGLAQRLARLFLTTKFEGGRHERRVLKIMALEGGR